MSRNERLELRREAKFTKNNIAIKEERTTEERGKNNFVDFKFAVYCDHALIARATTKRYALKAAHNYIAHRS